MCTSEQEAGQFFAAAFLPVRRAGEGLMT